jgi:NAD(P)-dependent dehydrogenase (short-subunit alcohol dehydrogenase family)
VNLEGAYRMMRAAIPEMLKAGWGAIVNVSSTHGQVGLQGSAIYCASKGGLINLTRAVALDYAKHGIRCNCVCPAAVETDMLAPALSDPATRAWIVGNHPIGRIGTPADVARSILHLSCDDASWVTGSVFTIDGGLTAQ